MSMQSVRLERGTFDRAAGKHHTEDVLVGGSLATPLTDHSLRATGHRGEVTVAGYQNKTHNWAIKASQRISDLARLKIFNFPTRY